MTSYLSNYMLFDGVAFLIIGIIVLISPSPQPTLSQPLHAQEVEPFSQTRRLLAAMFIASGLMLIVIARHVNDINVLHEISLVRILSFVLIIVLNLLQYKSKRWKPGPLIGLMSLFTIMSAVYVYFILAA